MATIYEVSKLAGVSLATVSRVMNNSARVSEKTRLKVETAMEALGYTPNSIAQSLASNRSNSVGVLVPELHGPFFGEILAEVELSLREAGKYAIITAGHSDKSKEIDGIDFLLSRRCDALILYVDSVPNEHLLEVARNKVPIVLINRLVPELAHCCINLENEYGGYIAARALLKLGHRRLACISGPLWKQDARDRLMGFKRAMKEFGAEVDDRLLYEGSFQEASGSQGMKHLLETGIPFSALVCGNDEMAAGAISMARKKGLEVREDFSVIGFDNAYFTRYMHPLLSTVNHPVARMGRMAARCILKNVYGQKDVDVQNLFRPRLVMRASVRAVDRDDR
jgi:LacI family transcriptional regulator